MRLERVDHYSKQDWLSTRPLSLVINTKIEGRTITLEDSNGQSIRVLLEPDMGVYKIADDPKWEPTTEQVKDWARQVCADYLSLGGDTAIDGHAEGLAYLLQEWAEEEVYTVFESLSDEILEHTLDGDNLLPCPWCGADACVFQSGYKDLSYEMLQLELSEYWAVECNNCNCDGFRGYYPNKETAVDQWNRRPEIKKP